MADPARKLPEFQDTDPRFSDPKISPARPHEERPFEPANNDFERLGERRSGMGGSLMIVGGIAVLALLAYLLLAPTPAETPAPAPTATTEPVAPAPAPAEPVPAPATPPAPANN